MKTPGIRRNPSREAATALLAAAQLPTRDLENTDLGHFFYAGPRDAPSGLVGLEVYGADALLRSLVVDAGARTRGLGSALLAQAEEHARATGVNTLFLLTTTAEAFFAARGYARAPRDAAPAAIRRTSEFSQLCPASSAFMVKYLRSH